MALASGCTARELRDHIRKKFRAAGLKQAMSDARYGKAWHLAFRRPVATFDLKDAAQQQQCFHWSNIVVRAGPVPMKPPRTENFDEASFGYCWTRRGWIRNRDAVLVGKKKKPHVWVTRGDVQASKPL